jgi:putative aldouronate transport system substrate-binding protein
VLNFLAAPIGSREHLHRKFGVEGKDFTFQDGYPVLTQQGNTNFLDVQYIVDSPTIIGPAPAAGADLQHRWHQRSTANLIPNPTIGLYSDTNSRKGNSIGTMMTDVITGVVFGRNTMKDYEETYGRWRSQGGDKIAAEFAEAKQASEG